MWTLLVPCPDMSKGAREIPPRMHVSLHGARCSDVTCE